MFRKTEKKYSRLSISSSDADTECSLMEDSSSARLAPARKWFLNKFFYANVALFLLSVSLTFISYAQSYQLMSNSGNRLLKGTSFYSPLLDKLSIPITTTRVNGSLLNMNNNIYRMPPSPEVDAAWERLANLNAIPISTEDVIKLGKDPSKTVKFPVEFGYGPDAHIGELDIMHQIHCLNGLRRDLYWQHYFKDRYPDGTFPELHQVHTSHCLYVILQSLMCSASTDIVTQDWVEGQKHPFPDFSINRKCKDFDAILDWQERNAINQEKLLALSRPKDQVPVPMSDEFKRMFGVGNDDHDS